MSGADNRRSPARKAFPRRRRQQRPGARAALCSTALLAAIAGPLGLARSATASQPGSARGSQGFVRIGPLPALPRGAARLGELPGSKRIELDVALRPRDPDELAGFAQAVSTPGSPQFRHYLAPRSFGEIFGATGATLRTTEAALTRLGLRVDSVSSNNLILKVSSSVETAERALGLKLVRYRLPGGQVGFTSLSAPRLPAFVARGVLAIVGLSDLAPSRPLGLARRSPAPGRAGTVATRSADAAVATGGPRPCKAAVSAAAADGALTADQLASAYGFSGLYGAGDLGAGETIAVYELEPNSKVDIAAYQKCYQTAAKVSYVKVDAGSGSGAGTGEAALDIENVIGLAPRANIDVYEGPDNAVGPLDVYNSIISKDLAKVISVSWGDCEAQDGGRAVAAVEANLFEEAAAQGQTVVAASGDEGSTDCTTASGAPIDTLAVDDPGSQPYVTSVGGTTLRAPGPPPTEVVWNGGVSGGAGGGGISTNWPMPAYQSGAPARLRVIKAYSSARPCATPAGDCREVPDVAADADPQTGYLVFWERAWTALGGTSGAAPLWAALAALVDAWPACSAHPAGFLNPGLYTIAAGKNGPLAFNDVTHGNDDIFRHGHYPATVGYDLASGLGTPDAANRLGHGLVAQLCALGSTAKSVYASPTRSTVVAVRLTAKANGTAFSVIKVTLRTAFGAPVAGKRVILVGTGTTTKITPNASATNVRGVASFEVRNTAIQRVVYRATDLTDGVFLEASATVTFVKP